MKLTIICYLFELVEKGLFPNISVKYRKNKILEVLKLVIILELICKF